jgi:hypothetical protein
MYTRAVSYEVLGEWSINVALNSSTDEFKLKHKQNSGSGTTYCVPETVYSSFSCSSRLPTLPHK